MAALAAALAMPVHAREPSGTLKKVKDTGAITLGIRDSRAVQLHRRQTEDRRSAVDICMKIVDEIKAELKLDKLKVNESIVTSSTRILLMANGTVDLECGSTTNNAAPQKTVAHQHALHHGKALRVKESVLHGIRRRSPDQRSSIRATASLQIRRQLRTLVRHEYGDQFGRLRGAGIGRDQVSCARWLEEGLPHTERLNRTTAELGADRALGDIGRHRARVAMRS